MACVASLTGSPIPGMTPIMFSRQTCPCTTALRYSARDAVTWYAHSTSACSRWRHPSRAVTVPASETLRSERPDGAARYADVSTKWAFCAGGRYALHINASAPGYTTGLRRWLRVPTAPPTISHLLSSTLYRAHLERTRVAAILVTSRYNTHINCGFPFYRGMNFNSRCLQPRSSPIRPIFIPLAIPPEPLPHHLLC